MQESSSVCAAIDQDAARLRAHTMTLPPIECTHGRVATDVDDLTEGRGAEYVDDSSTVLVFISQGYFQSLNCMRELVRATVTAKPIIAVVEPDAKHGGLGIEEVSEELRQMSAPMERNGMSYEGRYKMWGLDAEIQAWGHTPPSYEDLYAALFAHPLIEWSRISAFQDT